MSIEESQWSGVVAALTLKSPALYHDSTELRIVLRRMAPFCETSKIAATQSLSSVPDVQ